MYLKREKREEEGGGGLERCERVKRKTDREGKDKESGDGERW